MNKVFAHHEFFKGHLVTIIGVMLCLYFSYHSIFGHRSILALHMLESQIEKSVSIRDNIEYKRQILEHKVASMRPDSLNPDLLEERARSVLGYKRSDEVLVLSN